MKGLRTVWALNNRPDEDAIKGGGFGLTPLPSLSFPSRHHQLRSMPWSDWDPALRHTPPSDRRSSPSTGHPFWPHIVQWFHSPLSYPFLFSSLPQCLTPWRWSQLSLPPGGRFCPCSYASSQTERERARRPSQPTLALFKLARSLAPLTLLGHPLTLIRIFNYHPLLLP